MSAPGGLGLTSLAAASTCRRHSSPYVDQQQQMRARRRLTRPGHRPTVVVVPEVTSVVQRHDDLSPTMSRAVSLRLDERNPTPDTSCDRRPSQLPGKVRAHHRRLTNQNLPLGDQHFSPKIYTNETISPSNIAINANHAQSC